MKKQKNGFTVLEVIVVVSIIGLLAGLGVIATNKLIGKSRVHTAYSELQLLATAVSQLGWDTGKWPNGAWRDKEIGRNNEMRTLANSAIFEIPSGENYNDWKGPYYEGSVTDPWGNPYFFDDDYRIDGEDRVVIGSHGPNGSGINQYDSDNIWVALDDLSPASSEGYLK